MKSLTYFGSKLRVSCEEKLFNFVWKFYYILKLIRQLVFQKKNNYNFKGSLNSTNCWSETEVALLFLWQNSLDNILGKCFKPLLSLCHLFWYIHWTGLHQVCCIHFQESYFRDVIYSTSQVFMHMFL